MPCNAAKHQCSLIFMQLSSQTSLRSCCFAFLQLAFMLASILAACIHAALYSCNLAFMLPCILAACIHAALYSCSLAFMLSCILAALHLCCLVFLQPCIHAASYYCSLVFMLPCFLAALHSCMLPFIPAALPSWSMAFMQPSQAALHWCSLAFMHPSVHTAMHLPRSKKIPSPFYRLVLYGFTNIIYKDGCVSLSNQPDRWVLSLQPRHWPRKMTRNRFRSADQLIATCFSDKSSPGSTTYIYGQFRHYCGSIVESALQKVTQQKWRFFSVFLTTRNRHRIFWPTNGIFPSSTATVSGYRCY